MELCPLCEKMTAERSHYTGILICYNRFCEKDLAEKLSGKKEESMTVNELLVLMRRIRERVKNLENLKSQVSTRESWMRGDAEKTITPNYDIKILDRKIMELENFLFKADAAIKQSNATTRVALEVNVDALLAPLE